MQNWHVASIIQILSSKPAKQFFNHVLLTLKPHKMKLSSVAGRKRACNPSSLVTEVHTFYDYFYRKVNKFSYSDSLEGIWGRHHKMYGSPMTANIEIQYNL